MTLQDLFDQLLTERVVLLALSKQESESLRVQLAKKWSLYKSTLDSCGFLSEELAACSLMRRPGETDGTYEYLLAPRQRQLREYTILPASPAPNLSENQQ